MSSRWPVTCVLDERRLEGYSGRGGVCGRGGVFCGFSAPGFRAGSAGRLTSRSYSLTKPPIWRFRMLAIDGRTGAIFPLLMAPTFVQVKLRSTGGDRATASHRSQYNTVSARAEQVCRNACCRVDSIHRASRMARGKLCRMAGLATWHDRRTNVASDGTITLLVASHRRRI